MGDVLRGDLTRWYGKLGAASPALFGFIEVAAGAFADEALAVLASRGSGIGVADVAELRGGVGV